jgi:RNA recognition motif-containing protein
MTTLGQGRFHFCGESRRHNLAYRDKQEETRVLSQKYHGEPFPSQHLWVGNISTSVTEMTLAEQFSRFGDIESLKLYSTKNYAFVTLNTVEDAMYAKKRLHGTVLGGLAIRIEFVKGVSVDRLTCICS